MAKKSVGILGLGLVFSASLLFANTNPFMINANQRDFQAQQQNRGKKHLTAENIQLPSNARELKSVTFTYQNFDGTTETKELYIDKTIDWHYPITVTQQEAIRNITKRYFSLNDFDFFMEGSTFVIKSSKHKIVRHFLLANPTTIIVDFSRDGGLAYDGKFGTGEQYYSDVSVNARDNIYRVTIILDGNYQYKLKSSKDGRHTITLQ